MNKPWFDINHSMGLPEAEKEKEWTMPPPPPPEPEKPKEKLPPEFKFTELKVIIPEDGLKENKPFDIDGTVELLADTANRLQIFLDAITRYSDKPDDCIGFRLEANLDRQTKKFSATFKTLYFHADFLRDKEKPVDATFMLVIKAYGGGAEGDFFSDPVTLPMPTKDIVLKKGHYDDTWSEKKENAEKSPKSGENYIPGDKVQKLQENLIQFKFLDSDHNTGYFGDLTETAVKKFQEFAKKPERKKIKDGRVFYLREDKITFTGDENGIADPKTEDEIAVWIQNEYVKPELEARKGDIDEEWLPER